ncbi:MAG: methyltransferase domain-containing protein [Anaerolineaceae bacterium]|nr:methyltransferase domain-containing protein [Anaerolineaceae bacterium]
MENYNKRHIAHWDKVAKKLRTWKGLGRYYNSRVSEIYQFNIPARQTVLDVGTGSGELLASLKPENGLGIDISSGMIELAKELHPNLNFLQMDAVNFKLKNQYDFVVLSDSINDLWDVQSTLENISKVLKGNGRLILNFYNRFWEFPLKIAENLNLAKPNLTQNWLTVDDTKNLLDLAGFEVIKSWSEVLFPFFIPIITPICNKFLVRLWPFKYLAMTNFIVARKKPQRAKRGNVTVSIIIPARNEAGNIESIFKRVPPEFKDPELIFVEGHSTDNTLNEIKKQIKLHPSIKSTVYVQSGTGKGDAVRLGFSKASGKILMILDADLTMPPENLPRFYDALVSEVGDFINGVRLVYPLQENAMRFFNLIGNKFFSVIFTFLLSQPVKDTLCGTKVLWKRDYEKIAANRSYFGNFDPFGDFDLLFGAAKLNLKIVDMPIRYSERVYGKTNIQRWKHGWLLLKMVLFAAKRLKFI